MPRKNKRKFFGKNKNKSAKLNQNAATTTAVSGEQEQSDSEDASNLVLNDSSAAMGQVESTEVNTETVKDTSKATITLKVITQFIGEVPKETRDDESVKIVGESSKNNDNGESLHKVGAVPKLEHRKEDVRSRHQQRSFDGNYRVESPKHICIERNQTPSKRHAMLIQEISESSSSEEVKQLLHSEATMKIDKVEHATSPKAYRVESPESSDENIINNTTNDVTVHEISESSSSESVKNEILASIEATPPALKLDTKNNLKIINIKELPSESTPKFDCKTEKKLNKAEEAILEALYGNKNLLTIPNLPLDVISEEGSDCGSDIDKQAKRIADEIDDDVFLPAVIKKPPLNFRRRQQVAEQPQLLSAKIIETESNIPESCKSWETTQGDSELQAELVYLTSASSSATDLSERGGDVTDTDIEDTSEDTEANSLLENISVPSFELDVPLEMKISQKAAVFPSEYFHENINEQKLPDILEEDEERSLDIIESQQQIENVNKELHHLVSEHEVIQTREKTVEREEETTSDSREKEDVEDWQMRRKEIRFDELELQLDEIQSQVKDLEGDRLSQVEVGGEEVVWGGHESQVEDTSHDESEESSSNLENQAFASILKTKDQATVKSQVREMKHQAQEIESQLEEIKNQVGEIKHLLENENDRKEAFMYDKQVCRPLEDYQGQVIEIVDFQRRVIFPAEDIKQHEGQDGVIEDGKQIQVRDADYQMSSAEFQVAGGGSQMADGESQVYDSESESGGSESQVCEIQSQKAEVLLERQNINTENQVVDLDSQVQPNESQVGETQSQTQVVEEQRIEIQAQNHEENSDVQVGGFESQVSYYQSQVCDVESQVDDVECQVNAVEFETAELQNQVIKAQNQEIKQEAPKLEETVCQVDKNQSQEADEKSQVITKYLKENENDVIETNIELKIDENDNQIIHEQLDNFHQQSQASTPSENYHLESTNQDYRETIEDKEKEEKLNFHPEIISDISDDKRKIITHDNEKPRDDHSNRVTPTLPFRRKNSSDSSSSTNSQCTIIRQIVEHVDPLKDLCMQSLKKIAFTHDAARDAKITIHKKPNSSSRNAPQIPIMNELELHFKNDSDNLEGRENRVITILQVPPETNRATSAQNHAWRGLPSTQNPNLMLALSPLQQSYMKTQDSNTSADVLLDMHKKFVERRAYHESEESDVVENSNNANSREIFRVNVSQMESANQLEDGYFGDRESSVENFNSKSPKANNSPETVSNLSEPVANCDNEVVASRPLQKSAEIEFRMNSIRNCLLRDEFFRSGFGEVKRDATDTPSTTDNPPPIECFETKKVELENELKRLDNERQELEEELKNLRSLQHFKREEFLHNEKKLQSLESHHSSQNDFNEFINSNEKLQQELYNEWQDKVLERYERKLSKTIKITSINDDDHHSVRAASEILRTMPIESEFMTKLRERRQRLSLPNETELNSSTESLHHQNEEIKKSKNIPAHLYEFLKYYEEEIALGKNSDESGESKTIHPLLIGLIGVSMCLCGYYIGKYFITQKSKFF